MKRAKDYVAEFEEAGKTEAAAHQILMAMLTEVHELIDKRKAKETPTELGLSSQCDLGLHKILNQNPR